MRMSILLWPVTTAGVLVQESAQPYFGFCETDMLGTFNAASVRHRIAIGSNSGKKTLTIRSQNLIRTDTPHPAPLSAET